MKDLKKEFKKRVLEIVRQIPKGETRTYGDVAKEAGHARAARAVGTIMSHNYDPSVPCHRVVRADGRIGEYNRGGEMRKCELLREERESMSNEKK